MSAGGVASRPVAVLAIVLLVALAGCSSLGAGGDQRTPYEVPERTPSSDGVGPPGVGNASIESPFLLVQSHVGVVSLESFRVVRERTVRAPDGTLLRSVRVDARVSTDRQQYHIETRRRGTTVDASTRVVHAAVPPGAEEGIRQETVLAVSLDQNGGISEATRIQSEFGEVIYPEDVLGSDPSYRDRLYRYLTVVDEAEVRPLQPGAGPDPDAASGTRYEITSLTTTDSRLLSPAPDATVSNVSISVVTDERGLIAEAVAEYTIERDGRAVQIRERITYPTIGSVSITRPEWFDEIAASTERTATPGDDAGPNVSVIDPGDHDDPRGRAPTDAGLGGVPERPGVSVARARPSG